MFAKADLGVVHVTMVTQAYSSVSSIFKRMLQMFHLDVSKVDIVMYVLP
jgi:hypothetical protein